MKRKIESPKFKGDSVVNKKTEYPYDLRITIIDNKIKELKLDDIKVGEKIKFLAEAECIGMLRNEYEGRKEERCEFQIQKLGIKSGNEEEEEKKATFFSNK